MKKQILVIESSTSGARSKTRLLTERILTELNAQAENVITTRDLVKHPLPHLTPETVAAFYATDGNHTTATSLSDQAVSELEAADILIIGAPMWNFSIPSALKAWIDHVVRARKTFTYGANGPEGLLKGKTAYIALASGGIYSEGPAKHLDFQETYLRSILGFIGIKDVRTIRAEGMAYGEESEKQAMISAEHQLVKALAA